MRALKVGLGIVCAAFLAVGAVRAQTPPEYPDPVAVFGTGTVGSWTTELTLSNPYAETVTADVRPSPGPITCIQPCNTEQTIPARGTVVLGPPLASVGVTYVDAFSQTPRVLARVRDARGRSVDLPVFRLSELIAFDKGELVFPGVQRGSGATSNLLLANIWNTVNFPGDAVTVRLEAFDGAGSSLGSRDVELLRGETRFLTDVLGFLGVDAVEVGQLSVKRIGGAGKFWGTLSIIRADGSLPVRAGARP